MFAGNPLGGIKRTVASALPTATFGYVGDPKIWERNAFGKPRYCRNCNIEVKFIQNIEIIAILG